MLRCQKHNTVMVHQGYIPAAELGGDYTRIQYEYYQKLVVEGRIKVPETRTVQLLEREALKCDRCKKGIVVPREV